MKSTGKVTPQELQNVTVMMAGIKGFTNISERLNPEELMINHIPLLILSEETNCRQKLNPETNTSGITTKNHSSIK